VLYGKYGKYILDRQRLATTLVGLVVTASSRHIARVSGTSHGRKRAAKERGKGRMEGAKKAVEFSASSIHSL
jgi:hypothetical protein